MADDQSQWDVVSNTPLPPGAQPAAPDQSQWDVVSNKPSPGSTQDKTESTGVPTFAQQQGITSPWLAEPLNFLQGMGAGVMSTARGVSQLAHKAIPAIPEIPESYATAPNTGVAGTLGKGTEQAAEFLAPGSLVTKGQEAIEGVSKLPAAAKWALKAIPEAGSAAGVTAAQTGGDLDAMKWAALLAGGTQMLQPALGKAGAALMGRSTGAGIHTIEKAAEGSPEFTAAMRGQTTEADVLQHLRDAAQGVKDERSAVYRQQLANLPGNLQLNLKSARNELSAALRSHGISWTIDPKTNQVVLDFSRSTISDPAAQGQVLNVVNDVSDWGTRPRDLTPLGVDTLKRRLGDLYAPSSNARALVQRVRNQVNTILSTQVPGYQKMTADYARASDFLDNVNDLSLNAKNDGTSIRKFATLMKQNNDFRRDLVGKLSEYAGRDLQAEIAGRALSGLTPHGLAGVGTGMDALLATLGLGHVVPLPGAVLGIAGHLGTKSPRIMGEVARGAGAAAPFVPRVVGSLPSQIYVRPPAQYGMPDTQSQGGSIVDRWPGREEQLRALTR